MGACGDGQMPSPLGVKMGGGGGGLLDCDTSNWVDLIVECVLCGCILGLVLMGV